jgi:hypothetical protein
MAATRFLLSVCLFLGSFSLARGQANPIFGVYRELWTNLNQSVGGLAALTNTAYNPSWPNSPVATYTKVYTNFETEANTGMNYYGQRLRTFVVPPASGNYVFWISSDDNSQLFVSSDENPANMAQVAWVSTWTNPREWTKEPNQQSAPLPLQAGCRYYVEARMQQGGGGDNLAVRWQMPNGSYEEPLTAASAAGTRMVPCISGITTPGIFVQPSNTTVVEGQNATFSVLVTNQCLVGYQWVFNGNNLVAGARAAACVVSNVSIALNNGQVYACVVADALGTVRSAGATLTVIRDTVPPAVARVFNAGTTNVQVIFSKPVAAASATNLANYAFTNGLPISGGVLAADNVTLTLTTAPLTYGSNYGIVINGVRDLASIPNTIATNTLAAFVALPYLPQDIGNPATASVITWAGTTGLNVTTSGGVIGGATDQCSFEYQMFTGDFDLSVRLPGLSASDPWAKAGLMARQTLDAGSRFAAALTTPSMSGSFFEWRNPANSPSTMAGVFPPNLPNAWLRLRRAATVFTGYASYDGQAWTLLGSASITMPAQVYVGLAVSSHNSNLAATAQFRNLGNVTSAAVNTFPYPHEPLGPCSRLTPIVISEIMYKPAPRADGNNLEFIELYNSNPYFEDISGFQLVSGSMTNTFPAGTILAGGAFLVAVASPQSIQNVYGITNVVGPYTGSLKKADTLQLLDDQGAILLTIPYSDVYPWPVAARGTGHSLILANPTYGEGDPRAWDISDATGGSPGQNEVFRPSPLRSVVINELLAHSENPAFLQFVELYNHSNQTNNLSGCILTDDPATNKFVLPAGTLVGPRGFVSFDSSQLGFALDGSGGTIYLIQPDGSRVLDAVQFEAQADGVSFGRWPDGANALYPLAARTPGTNNSPVQIGDIVINELMYDPISGNDDDQYLELYNQGTNTVSLANWQFVSGVSFVFPVGTALAPDSYLVVARNPTNLFAEYTNLNWGNTVGGFGGKLSHKGERVALAMPQALTVSTGSGFVTNTIFVVEDEVTYGTGGRWGQWAHAGGSSLELINPNSNHRLAANWADSDETTKSAWTNLEFTGVLDNGANYTNGVINLVQVGLLDVGECLVDNLEARPGGTNGVNIIANGTFEAGLTNWTPQGDHVRSSLETATGLGGYQSGQSLHLRSTDGFWTLGDYVQGTLTQTNLAAGQTATLRLKARWVRGWPEVLMRLRGNWLEVAGKMPVPANLGTPGMRNSRYVPKPGPAIYEVKHAPAIPPANAPVVVTARIHDTALALPTLLYRIDTGVNPAPAYTRVAMLDNGTGGDAIAGDGLYSATIPGQAAGTVVAFLIKASDSYGASTIFPADLTNNAGVPRECVVAFGDPVPTGSFSQHHVFITQNWANRWAQGGGVSHETHDGTWVDGGGRIIYNWMGRYAGSPYHQYLGSPVTTVAGMHWLVPDDDQLFGTVSLNKQHVPGNGPLDDDTLQREQASFWMAHQIGLKRQNRRFYVYYVNGNRHAPLMEDAQVPDGAMISEYWPNDSNGWLFKNHIWFEGDVAQQPDGYMNFTGVSGCLMDKFTTTINGVPNQYKLARYRWMWWIRQYPDSASDYSQVFALIDAANTPTTSASYYANVEAQVDTEEWLRLSAIEHATGDWDSWLTQDSWNMYCYKPTLGKWTALKWDWNITLGVGGYSWGPDGSQLLNLGPGDSVKAAFFKYPPYFRSYLRGLQDVADLAMNNAKVNPMLDAKYASFVANGLTANANYGLLVQDPAKPGGLEDWISTMHNSILAVLGSQNVTNVAWVINSTLVSSDVVVVRGTAPLAVSTFWFNGIEWPVTWTTVTNWTATVPLKPGTNSFTVTGVDLHNQPVPGATSAITAVYNQPAPSPLGEVVINEIMSNPAFPDAEYVELYNRSPTLTFDLSGCQFEGLSYTFPAGSAIRPNSYLLLVADPSAFATVYGGTMPPFDTFSGELSADGGTLSLIQPATNGAGGLPIAQVRYGSAPPWPAPVAGSSLQLIDSRLDNWRPGNWTLVQTNKGASALKWVFVTASIPASTTSTLYLYLTAAGDLYLDDLQLLDARGVNTLADGDFESPLAGAWNVSPNFTNSALSTTIKHSGNSSLHLVASAAGTGSGNAIDQAIQPALTPGQTYTLSFWYLQNASPGAPSLVIRLASSVNPITINPAPPTPPVQAQSTPGAMNSVAASLVVFPTLWINELQAENLTGITNSAGQRVPWIELYNPGTNTVSLGGFYLANDYANLSQWAFPLSAVINPGQFQVIFADGQPALTTSNELHTSFALAAGSGSVVLSRYSSGQLQVLDYVDYANLAPNHSYGSFPDAQCFARQEFLIATPGGANNPGTAGSFIAYTQLGSVYTQDFNSLPNPGPASVNTANPVTINGITCSLPDPFDFALPPAASGQSGGLGLPALAGWFGLADSTASVGARFGATDGDQTTGGVISFGQPNSTNRALGLLATSTTGFTAFGARLLNATTGTLNHISLQLTGELWRQSDKPKVLQCYYLVDHTATNLFSTSMTALLPGLNVAFPTAPADVGGVAVDGTLPANQVSLSVAGQAITNWPPGAALWLVWEMADPTGKAQGLAIDDLSFSAWAAPVLNPVPLTSQLAGTSLILSWTSFTGQSYQIQFKNNLNDPAWQPLGAPIPGTGSPISATNDLSAPTQRFFRLSILPEP